MSNRFLATFVFLPDCLMTAGKWVTSEQKIAAEPCGTWKTRSRAATGPRDMAVAR